MGQENKGKPTARSVNISISEQAHKGVYANKVIVAHSADEFILDFVADFPPGPQIVSRVITAPAHARALLATLRENLERFERQHGPIRRRSGPGTPPADA
ncbi:MAG: DUF3467 domain-containing protein [Acidobacteriota bacterium]|nr:DUF3467 domain-containing protein [Acidobacteriota bacterium]MDQ7086631.1 DUF3467 domain-containing protein [Acidobacteriota bacterium]